MISCWFYRNRAFVFQSNCFKFNKNYSNSMSRENGSTCPLESKVNAQWQQWFVHYIFFQWNVVIKHGLLAEFHNGGLKIKKRFKTSYVQKKYLELVKNRFLGLFWLCWKVQLLEKFQGHKFCLAKLTLRWIIEVNFFLLTKSNLFILIKA